MSDSRRMYRAIKQSLKQLYPEEPRGNVARHLETLVALICGIIRSKSCQLPQIASEVPGVIQTESQVKKFSRWLKNDDITAQQFFLPFAAPFLTSLAAIPDRELALIMDGSAMARDCVVLMVSVVYAHRAIPIGWVVIEGQKGHFPTEAHLALVQAIRPLIPATTPVIFLGDGEFDSPELQAEVNGYGWHYACRTAKNIHIDADGQAGALEKLMSLEPGLRIAYPDVLFTEKAYGPVMVIGWWDPKYQEPIYLVSNMVKMQTACAWYQKRMQIETFFSDQKSRGFNIDRSHLSDPTRVSRLVMAATLAYIWLIYLGTVAQSAEWQSKIHRGKRCDLSLFQLGWRLLRYWLKNDLPIKGLFKLEPESVR